MTYINGGVDSVFRREHIKFSDDLELDTAWDEKFRDHKRSGYWIRSDRSYKHGIGKTCIQLMLKDVIVESWIYYNDYGGMGKSDPLDVHVMIEVWSRIEGMHYEDWSRHQWQRDKKIIAAGGQTDRQKSLSISAAAGNRILRGCPRDGDMNTWYTGVEPAMVTIAPAVLPKPSKFIQFISFIINWWKS